MVTEQRMTVEEFRALPHIEIAVPPDLVDGELVLDELIPWRHQTVLGNLVFYAGQWERAEAGRGRFFPSLHTQLDEYNYFSPDLLWWAEGNGPALEDPPPYPMFDLAVEIRSAISWKYDIHAKWNGYQRHGLLEYWLVDTESESVLVYRRSKPSAKAFDIALELAVGETLTSPQLPGFELPIDTVFADR